MPALSGTPHMIGETTRIVCRGRRYEQQARDFVMHTLRLHLKRLEQELNRKLFPRDNGKFVRFDLSDLIEGDAKAQTDYNRPRWAARYWAGLAYRQ